MATATVSLDPDLIFTYAGTRLADSDPLTITALGGSEVTVQITAPMSFEASHDERGRAINWKPVPGAAQFTLAWSFPCPRSPFALTVSTTDATSGASKTKTKKVRIEAGASGTAKGRDVAAAHGGGSGGTD